MSAPQAHAEEPHLAELCDANGISKEEFIHNRGNVTSLEVFLVTFPSLQPCTWFTNLTELQIIHCGLKDMEGLQHCVHMEKMWLNENNLTKITCLDSHTALQELYLHGNQITKLDGLENCINLEVLWVMENNVKEIIGLEKLSRLSHLNLASNQIESVGSKLDPNTNLEFLGLAGNRIGSFRDIPLLDKLPNLHHLNFADPHYGENPVCQLCNYQTYTLYHLNRITKLDSIIVCDDKRHTAEATFVKKKMYYNMRIKTLKRNTSNLLKKGVQYKVNKISEINLSLNVLVKAMKTLEQELSELADLPAAVDTEPPQYTEDEIVKHLETLRQHIKAKQQEINTIEKYYVDTKGAIQAIAHHNISRLMVELQTGGNIRMEEGTISDQWYKSCVDLVRSRFFATNFEQFGIKDIRISKVTRIHNRFLRNRFEDRLDCLVDTSDTNHKRLLEYLFYGEDPELSGELLSALEDGFRSPPEYERMNKDAGVPLSNSVFICEQARLSYLMEHGLIGLRGQVKPNINRNRNCEITGRLLITKVFLGRTVQERESQTQHVDSNGNAPLAPPRPSYVPLISRKNETNWQKVKRKDYTSATNSVYRIKVGDNKQRVWFAFDQHLILPEYLVEFVYICSPESIQYLNNPNPMYQDDRSMDEMHSTLSKLLPIRSEVDATDMRSFTIPFLTFVHQCQQVVSSDKDVQNAVVPFLKDKRKHTEVTMPVLKEVTRVDVAANMTHVNLFNCGLTNMGNYQLLVNLKTLVLCFNELSRIDGIENLENLETLDISYNLIKRVENFKGLNKLVNLELNNNLIYRLEDINVLKRTVPQLKKLNLCNNAICDVKSYKWIVLRRLSNLDLLDNKSITDNDREIANEKLSAISTDLILHHSSYQPVFGWSLSFVPLTQMLWEGNADGSVVNYYPTMGSKQALGNDETLSAQMQQSPEILLARVVELNLSRLRIRKIQGLERLRSLRKLNLMDNEINRIEGLDTCTRMEELCLEDNRVSKIEGLSTLLSLRKLELGKNKISKIENVETLNHLCQLSLEDNDITSLVGFNKIQNLMELYIGNNKIECVKEINSLRDVNKLIILDLSGNPLSKDPECRLYSIYHLKKLKVLDGVSVDPTENQKARETFSGKMTTELLLDRVGNDTEFNYCTTLNLSSCGIKEISLLESFTSLQHIQLDHNNILDLNGIQVATELVSVNMSYNKLAHALDTRGDPNKNTMGKYLSQLNQLTTLVFDNCQITVIGALQLRIPSLTYLSLKNNDITKVDGLEGCPNLQELVLDKNKIRQFEERPLQALTKLRSLKAEYNSIKTLDGLKALCSLNKLTLQQNRISDLNELDKLEGLDLVEVFITGNAIARKSFYRLSLVFKISSLQWIDGRQVTVEEREKAQAFFNQEYQYYQQHPPHIYTDQRTPFTHHSYQQSQQHTQQSTTVTQYNMPSGTTQQGGSGGGLSKVGIKMANVVNFEYQGQSDAGNPIMSLGVGGSNGNATKLNGPLQRAGGPRKPLLTRTSSADSSNHSGGSNSINKRKGLPGSNSGTGSGGSLRATPSRATFVSPRPTTGTGGLPRV